MNITPIRRWIHAWYIEVFFISALFLISAGCTIGTDGIDRPSGSRDRLIVDELFANTSAGIVHNDYFMPIKPLDHPPHDFAGTIHFEETKLDSKVQTWDIIGEGQSYFPKFSISFLSYRDHLIPVTRNLIYSGEKKICVYNIIVSPGKIWREIKDGDYSRASFPFTLSDNYAGQSRSGIATFIYNKSKTSNTFVQITQESAPKGQRIQADMSGLVRAEYDATDIEGKHDLIAAFEQELSQRMVIKPWEVLKNGKALKEVFNRELNDTDISIAAVVIDNQIFLQPSMTRSGPYPYPESLRTGVYSITKSLAAGLSMFYLAEKYGETVFDELITDYIPVFADHPGWRGVTFGHALNMVTGTRGSDAMKDIGPFVVIRSAKSKIKAIKRLENKSVAPGQKFAYATTNTFVLSYAMDQYVKTNEDPDADLWQMVEKDVLRPIGIYHFPIRRTKERKGRLGPPIMGFGSYPNVDEVAKIAVLFQNEGVHKGKQLLNRNKIRQALNKTSWYGYKASQGRQYQHSIWLSPGINAGNCTTEISSMIGRGGNYISFYPNNIIAIRFADAMNYTLDHMATAVGQMKNLCND